MINFQGSNPCELGAKIPLSKIKCKSSSLIFLSLKSLQALRFEISSLKFILFLKIKNNNINYKMQSLIKKYYSLIFFLKTKPDFSKPIFWI